VLIIPTPIIQYTTVSYGSSQESMLEKILTCRLSTDLSTSPPLFAGFPASLRHALETAQPLPSTATS
jgi:hypothetical protein